MKKQNIIERSFKQRVYRNEKAWKTKKAKKAHLYIIAALLFMLTVQTVQYLFQPEILVIENKPMSWDTRKDMTVDSSLGSGNSYQETRQAPTAIGVSVEGALEEKIASYFPEDSRTAIAIAKAESNMNPLAVGDGHIMYLHEGKPMGMSCGVFQVRVLPGRPSCEELQVIDKNLETARKIYESRGWSAWSVYTNESYKKFL